MVKQIHFISIVKYIKALSYCVNFEKKASTSVGRKNIYCDEQTCKEIIKLVGERYVQVSEYQKTH